MRVLLCCGVLSLALLDVNAGLSRPAKRRSAGSASSTPTAADSIVDRVAQLLHIATPRFMYHSDIPGDRTSLIDALWSCDWTEGITNRFTAANPELTFLFEAQRVNQDEAPTRFHTLQGQQRWEAVISSVFRGRSQKWIPIETAALSILWLHYRVPEAAWQAARYFGRFIMSRTWTEDLCDEAVDRDPGAQYPVQQGISAAVFDNFQMKVDYASFSVNGETGTKIEMTNWATVFLPAMAMPPGFPGFDAILGAGGMFKPVLNFDQFLDSFSSFAPDITSGQKSRWITYLEWVTAGAGVQDLWDTDEYNSPYPPTKFHFHDPIFDRLQSSYEDVNFEINYMRKSRFHKFCQALMVGGDGLSFMRLIHRLSQDPRKYLETTPIIIPRLGENPHGLFHIMHGDWRIWSPLLLRFAEVVDNKQVRGDPCVAEFNKHQHFLRICIQACAEFVSEISKTGTDFHLVQRYAKHVHSMHHLYAPHATSITLLCCLILPPYCPQKLPPAPCQRFLRESEDNLSFAYIVCFLYLFGFKFLEYRHAVRHNQSHILDRLWRENLASARTALANKVNYRQMSIALVYWGVALVEPLQTFYHNTRTIRWIFSHVGWDMPIEKLNMWIKESVVSNISRMQICQYIRRLNFVQHVRRVVLRLSRFGRKRDTATPKDVRADVDKIKAFLHAKIGTTYAACTTPSNDNVLSVDMSRWGGRVNPRSEAPFMQIRRANRGHREYVRDQITKLCPWQRWA